MASDPSPNPDTVDDETSFLAFARVLEEDRRLAAKHDSSGCDAPRGWQNATIEQFIEAALAWADDSEFGRRQRVGDAASPWRRFAAFLHAGKVYE